MGFIRNLKQNNDGDAKEDKKKSKFKKTVTALILKLVGIIKVSLMSGLLIFALCFCTWVIEKFTAEDTPKEIYEELEVEQVRDLVEIKGNESDGYHLEFVEDIDEKLDSLIDTLNRREGMYTLKKSNKELLKKMIKAEVVTQFPDLGGKVDENDSNQFQGAITVRRVTPDKEIGELKSTGAGEKTTADDLKADNNEEDKKITYEKGQELQLKATANVYLKGDYDFLGNKKSDDGVTAKFNTMTSRIEGVDSSVYVVKGDKVYYTGNTFYYDNNTYIEIAKEKDAETVIGYVKNINIEIPKTTTSTDKEDDNSNDEEKNIQPTKTIGDGTKEFVIAIAAGHNSSDDKGYSEGEWVEEELTIQVANEVEELFKEYSNVSVVQTGSTNNQDVKREERTQLAKDANPDLCVQIYFNSGDNGSGVEACYEYGDGKSEKLAELLSKKISEKMGLEDRGTVTQGGISDYYDIIDSSADTGFPSVITKGCFLDNKKDQDVLKNGGISQYAKGIVEACEEYLVADKGDDTVTYVEQNDTYSRTRSRIHDLKYVSQETFKKYVDESDKRALEVYTLDDSYNLVTATWKVDGTTEEDAVLTINQNSAMNFRTILEKVTMPYEYLLFFLIDSEQKKFVEDLADVVIDDTEIIIAVQDNITTTKVTTTIQQSTKITSDTGEKAGQFAEDWHNVPDDEDKFSEICSTSESVTYADTWFMKYSKGNTYSSNALDVDKGEYVDIIKNVKGKVNETRNRTDVGWNEDDSGGKLIDQGSKTYHALKKGTTSKAEDASGESVEEYHYTYAIYERKETITHVISNSYDTGGEAVVSGDISKFVELFQEYKMSNAIAEEWLFDIIEDNEKTANLADLTRYMVFKATEIDYGVTDFDFSEFDLSAFSSMGGIYGGTIQEKIWFTLRGLGYSKEAVAAAMGNIDYESAGFNPAIIEGGSGEGIGLCQWSFGRRTALESYAASKGVEWTDENTQVEFLVAEISGKGAASGYATQRKSGYILNEGITSTHDDWANATSIDDATLYFMRFFESPASTASLSERQARAKKYYEEFKDRTMPTGADILSVCEDVMNDMISRNVHYSISSLTWNNIEASSKDPYACCATYVSIVLYKSGLLTVDQINAYNYHWTGSGGVPDMLAAAGWVQIDPSQKQPGDIINNPGVHVAIYAGGDKIYDQSCGVVSSSGNPPKGAAFTSSYATNSSYQVWRAP